MVEKPYIHLLTYVITAAAVASILAAYLTRRSKPTVQRYMKPPFSINLAPPRRRGQLDRSACLNGIDT